MRPHSYVKVKPIIPPPAHSNKTQVKFPQLSLERQGGLALQISKRGYIKPFELRKPGWLGTASFRTRLHHSPVRWLDTTTRPTSTPIGQYRPFPPIRTMTISQSARTIGTQGLGSPCIFCTVCSVDNQVARYAWHSLQLICAYSHDSTHPFIAAAAVCSVLWLS